MQRAGDAAPSPEATKRPPEDWYKRGVWIDPDIIEKRMQGAAPVDTGALEAETVIGKSLSAIIRVRPVLCLFRERLEPTSLRADCYAQTV